MRSASAAGRLFEAPDTAPEPWKGEPAPFTPTSAAEAEEWLTTERAHWVGALPVMSAAGRHREILHTARTLYWFSDRWDAWPEWRTLFSHGVRAAAALGDRSAEAHQLNCLAWTYSVSDGRHREAEEHACRALELATDAGDIAQQAWASTYIAGACMALGRPAEAAEAAESAVRLFATTGDEAGQAVSRRVLGSALRETGRAEEALSVHLALLGVRAGDVPGFQEFAEAIVRHQIARDLLALERWPEAVQAFRAVIAPVTHGGTSRFQAQALAGLATALERCGELTEAHAHFTEAHRLFVTAGDTASADETATALTRLAGTCG